MSIPVAFSAYPSTTTDYVTGSIVQFDVVVTNIGSSYSNDISVFQCPVNGIYLFAISLQSTLGFRMQANIIKDGSVLLSSYSDDENNIQSSTLAVTECLASETVWVECIGDNQQLIGDNRSSFSGVLITPVA